MVVAAPSHVRAETQADKFVRTANYFLLSGTTLEDPKTIEALTRFDLLILPAEAQVFNATFFTEARRRNPDIVILAYVPTVSYNNAFWSDALHVRLKRGIENDWWLTDGSDNPVSIWPNTSALNLNSGWTDYLAEFVDEQILATDLWDGVFYDEVSDAISWVGAVDTDRDGSADRASTADANWHNGYVNLFRTTRQRVGSHRIVITNGSSDSAFQPYVNGRMFESFPTPWENGGGWDTVMSRYLSLQNEVGYEPLFVMNGNTNNSGVRDDYRHVRFVVASTLLGNGYVGYDVGTESHAQTWEYDEYHTYLGEPKGEPEDALNASNRTMTESVWQRDFVNGKVVVNATDEHHTIRLDGDYEKLHGTQDTTVNNGSIVSRVTLEAEDGVLLLRPLERIDDAVFENGAFARVYQASGRTERTGFFAYDAAHRGGQRVVHTDLDGDDERETVVANDSQVSIFDKNGALHATFYPYTSAFQNGVTIAVGDLEGDGSVEIVTGTKSGGPQLRIFNRDGVLIHPGFFAYDTAFRGGVQVAIGDLNGDNIKEIITGAGVGGGPHVRVFNKDGKVINPGFFAYDAAFRGGVNVAVADVDGDGIDDMVTGAGAGGGPQVRVFDRNGTLKSQFFADDESSRRGIDVSAADVDGDGVWEILGLSSEVFTFSAK
jgi:hypothetical protein